MKKPKTIRRMVPCSVYQTEKLQNWLKHMADEGLILKENGFHVTFAAFKKSEPAKLEYRIWPENGLKDYDNAKHHRESFGWKYVSRAGNFEIYSSLSSEAKAVDFDEKSQIYLQKAIKKKYTYALINLLLNLAIFAFICLLIPYIIVAVSNGVFLAFCLSVAFLSRSVGYLMEAINLRKLSNEQTDNAVDRESGALVYKILSILKLVGLTVLLIVIIGLKFDEPVSNHISACQDELPFATVADLAPDAEYTLNDSSYFNTYTQWETLAACDNYEWKESATLKFSDGTENSIRLLIDYHETANPTLAKAVALEYLWEDKLSSYGYDYEKDLPELDVDYGALYYNEIGDITLILQKDTKLIKAYLSVVNEDFSDELLNQWIETVANYL